MTSLIDRDALIAQYDRLHIGKPGQARQLMVEAPEVDAVPVIHCRDCKYYDHTDTDLFGEPLKIKIETCYRWEEQILGVLFIAGDGDGYCSWAERRIDE